MLRISFNRLSRHTAQAAGHPAAFLVAVGLVLAWILAGPFLRFNDTWLQLVGTVTAIATFLMIFLIQHTQNQDTAALQLKLDELIRAMDGAHNSLLDLEELSQEELDRFKQRYEQLARQAREQLKNGSLDTGKPAVGNP